MKEATIHTTINGCDVSALVEYTDKDDAEIVSVTVPLNRNLFRDSVAAIIDGAVWAVLPEMIAEEAAEAQLDRDMEDNPIVRMTGELDHALREAME